MNQSGALEYIRVVLKVTSEAFAHSPPLLSI